jgi:hypothetical protein
MIQNTLIADKMNQYGASPIEITLPSQYFSRMDEPNQEYEPVLEPKNPSKQSTFYIL